MNINDFKRRYILSLIEPPFFYIPLYKNTRERKKIDIPIVPLTRVKMKTFQPYPNNPDVTVPYYTFTTDYAEADNCGSVEKYTTTTDSDPVPTYGCSYRIYKKVNDKYIAINKNGDLDPEEKSPLLKNQQTVKLGLGKYYYREYVASEGDSLMFSDLEIYLFQKTKKWKQSEEAQIPVILDYTQSDIPQDSKGLFYIRYFSLEDNKIHETFEGYKGYKNKQGQDVTFFYKIYHKPKLLKVYTRFKTEAEHLQSAEKDMENYYYWSISYVSGVTVGNVLVEQWIYDEIVGQEHDPWYNTNLLSDGSCTESDKVIDNPIYKVIPYVDKIVFMDKQIFTETKEELIDNPNKNGYNIPLIFLKAGHWSSAIMGGICGVCLRYNITFQPYQAQKTLYVDGVQLTESFLMEYDKYTAGNYAYRGNDEYSALYSHRNIGVLGCGNQDNHHSISQSLQVGAAVERSNLVTNSSKKGEATLSLQTSFTPVSSSITRQTYLNGAIVEVSLRPTIQESTFSWTNEAEVFPSTYPPPAGSSTEYSMREDQVKTAISYVCAEDVAQFAVRLCSTISKKDPDNLGGYSSYMMTGKENAYPAFFRTTAYEDEHGEPKVVYDETFNIETGIQSIGTSSLIDYKYRKWYGNPENEHYYPKMDTVKDLNDGYGCTVIFNRQTRKGYKEWMGVAEPLFESNDDYTITD